VASLVAGTPEKSAKIASLGGRYGDGLMANWNCIAGWSIWGWVESIMLGELELWLLSVCDQSLGGVSDLHRKRGIYFFRESMQVASSW
jgi:hypothetical protein